VAGNQKVAGRLMPVMGFPVEPLVLLSSVPGDVASALGGAVGTAAVAAWRRIVFLTDQNRADQIAHNAAALALTEALHAKEIASLKAGKDVA
jgi:hypothetical protein